LTTQRTPFIILIVPACATVLSVLGGHSRCYGYLEKLYLRDSRQSLCFTSSSGDFSDAYMGLWKTEYQSKPGRFLHTEHGRYIPCFLCSKNSSIRVWSGRGKQGRPWLALNTSWIPVVLLIGIWASSTICLATLTSLFMLSFSCLPPLLRPDTHNLDSLL
jgi:hypothetical protein